MIKEALVGEGRQHHLGLSETSQALLAFPSGAQRSASPARLPPARSLRAADLCREMLAAPHLSTAQEALLGSVEASLSGADCRLLERNLISHPEKACTSLLVILFIQKQAGEEPGCSKVAQAR